MEAAWCAADARLATGELREAVADYEGLLRSLPPGDSREPAVLTRLAAANLTLRRVQDAARWAKKAVEASQKSSASLHPNVAEAVAILARSKLAVGDFRAATGILEQASQPSLDEVRSEVEHAAAELSRADASLERGHVTEALECFQSLEQSVLVDAPDLLVRMGRCYLALGEVSRAQGIVAGLLRADPSNVDVHALRAELEFQAIAEPLCSSAWESNADIAIRSVRQVLALDPENRCAAKLQRRLRSQVAMVRQVRELMSAGDFAAAEELLSASLAAANGNAVPAGRFAARCYAERARCKLERGDTDGCLADTKSAAQLDSRLSAAPVLEARALQLQGSWEDAVRVLEALYAWDKRSDIFWKVEWAKFEVRRVKRPKYYDILGLQPTCTLSEIKRAYHRMSVENHPDKVLQRGPSTDMRHADEKFKMIAESFEFLADPVKKELYDKGYDAEGIREVLAVRKRAAGQAPCSQCGEDESGKLGSDGNWYCLRCWDMYYRDNSEEHPGSNACCASSCATNTRHPTGAGSTRASSEENQLPGTDAGDDASRSPAPRCSRGAFDPCVCALRAQSPMKQVSRNDRQAESPPLDLLSSDWSWSLGSTALRAVLPLPLLAPSLSAGGTASAVKGGCGWEHGVQSLAPPELPGKDYFPRWQRHSKRYPNMSGLPPPQVGDALRLAQACANSAGMHASPDHVAERSARRFDADAFEVVE